MGKDNKAEEIYIEPDMSESKISQTDVKPVLYTQGLDSGYGKKVVVKDVCISVRPGSILTLIGPNGAGKSTILKTIAGQLEKLSGTVYIDGRKDSQWQKNEMARILSMVMTERIHPELMTCRDVVSTGRYPYTGRLGILSDLDWEKTDEAIRAVHAEEVADRDFSQISDGQRQRIMLARALCQDTKILILDEPTSFLDLHYKVDILSTIRRMALKNNIAVIMSLHELEFASAVSDMVACVDTDHISRIGAPCEIIKAENIESLFKMPKGSCQLLAQALDTYAKALQNLI